MVFFSGVGTISPGGGKRDPRIGKRRLKRALNNTGLLGIRRIGWYSGFGNMDNAIPVRDQSKRAIHPIGFAVGETLLKMWLHVPFYAIYEKFRQIKKIVIMI